MSPYYCLIYNGIFRSNGFYRNVGTQLVVQLPKSTISNIVNEVAQVIASSTKEYIKFPTIEEQNVTAAHFAEHFKFPGVIGVAGMCIFSFQR